MKWIIEHFLEEEDIKIKEAADALGLDVVFKIMPNPYADSFVNYGLIHSSIQVAKILQHKVFHLTPWNNLRFQDYAGYWHKFLFNTEFTMMPAGSLLERFEDLQHQYGSKFIFIRPDTNDKLFNGGTYNLEEFKKLFNGYQVETDTLVVAAPAYKIDREYRCFMHKGKLLDYCQYKEQDRLSISYKYNYFIKEFAESIPQYPGLPPVYALDICEVNGKLFILEVGSANVAGFYACDPMRIIPAIVEETKKMYDEAFDDRF